jgi:hypothetical protein
LIINNFQPYIIKLIGSYLTDRFYRVHVRDGASEAREVMWGVAQGTVLAPALFNLYLHDIPRTEGVQPSMYKQDTALFVQSWRLDTITNRLNRAILSLQKYFNKWKIKMNPTKSQAILLKKRLPDRIPRLDICSWEDIRYQVPRTES